MLPGLLEDAGLFHPLKGQLVVVLVFELPRPKSSKFDCPKEDVDNLIKSIFDAGNGLIWDDDRQIVAVDAVKRWTEKVRAPGSISMSVEYRRER